MGKVDHNLPHYSAICQRVGRGGQGFDGDGEGHLFYRLPDGKEWIGDNELREKWQKKKKVLTPERV